MARRAQLPWLAPGDPFPNPDRSWGPGDPVPGLLAAGGAVDCATLQAAYRRGIFPWYSEGQPILWWSPDPRMVLRPRDFQLHHSLRKVLKRFRASDNCEIRIDHDFSNVITECSNKTRVGQSGTWITDEIRSAYGDLNRQGLAHSFETWIDGRLVGGLYCVALGKAVFGESMFSHAPDASKIALSALVCFSLVHGVELIDCQQNTSHLASLGAREIPRDEFLKAVSAGLDRQIPDWKFNSVYWEQLLGQPAVPK